MTTNLNDKDTNPSKVGELRVNRGTNDDAVELLELRGSLGKSENLSGADEGLEGQVIRLQAN